MQAETNDSVDIHTEEIDNQQKSTLISRNVTILGHRTSVRLEPEMWMALREIASRENCSVHEICSLIHLSKNSNTSLTAAIRVFLMLYYRASSTEDGHGRAGHGSFENMKHRARIPGELGKELDGARKVPKSSSAAMTTNTIKRASCAPVIITSHEDVMNQPARAGASL